MRLQTVRARPGDWIVIANGAPAPDDLSPQTVELDGTPFPAYVDGRDLRLRCPDIAAINAVRVSVNGVPLGLLQLLPRETL